MVLPLTNLADAAKTLVRLQALKNMIQAKAPIVSDESETAIITRANGFVWCDRRVV